MQIIILPQRGYALLIGTGIVEVLKELLTIRLTGSLIFLFVHTRQSFKVCLMAILVLFFYCMPKRKIHFYLSWEFPVFLYALYYLFFVCESFDLS